MLQAGYLIRRLTLQDLDQLMVIEHQSFSLPWSRESYEAELNNEWATYLACDWEGELAAYVGMWTLFEEAHITNLAVGKKFRGRGMGRALMHEEIKIARDKQAERILLEVRPSNQYALAMYETMGFVPSGRRKEYYSDNQEDAIVMTKFLNWRNRVLHGREQKGNG
jgi:[ribosomal protein S18]-alanine N-acetyltransferase